MEFGKLHDIRRVNFSLADDDPANAGALLHKEALPRPFCVVGAPVWSNAAWAGKVFPRGTPSRRYLERYSRQFGAVELNATHYAVPMIKTVEHWRDETPAGFRFVPKFPQEISHHRGLRDSVALAVEFVETMAHLGDRLGPLLLQLPPSFGPDQAGVLERFVVELRHRLPQASARLAVELRHPGWFAERRLVEGTRRLFESLRITSVITDVAGHRELSHASLTVPRALIRFVGNGLDPTDYTRIDAWAERIGIWLDGGVKEVYFFVHQPDDMTNPELLAYLAAALNRRCGGLPGWEHLVPWSPVPGEQLTLL